MISLPAQISLETHLQQGMYCKELQLSVDTEQSSVSLPLVSLHPFRLQNKNHSHCEAILSKTFNQSLGT